MQRRTFLSRVGALALAPRLAGAAEPAAQGRGPSLLSVWLKPARTYRPHTRWWWPGSAVTAEGITRQLEQMRAQGLGGVEITCVWEWYAKGNLPYLSAQWAAMVRHAVETAARLDMEVSLTFGPGWDLGGSWVPPEDRSKVLAPAWVDLDGPATFDGPLPEHKWPELKREGLFAYLRPPEGRPPDADRVVGVVAARLEGEALDGRSLTLLAPDGPDGRLRWAVPDGRWRVATFRLVYTGQTCASQNYETVPWIVDHLSPEAMRRSCHHLAQALRDILGDQLGSTVDSFFSDSFEVVPIPGTVLWSGGILGSFRERKGYDLAPYLPALFWEVGEETRRIRHDVNEHLHHVGLEAVFRTFVEEAGAVGVAARMQPHYRFTTEIIEAAGAAVRPETEVTTARFETVADPRKATVAGARFGGRSHVSAEAYNFIHRERYLATLEELKAATDAFLRDGITQLYNHGFVYTEEDEVAPSRDVPFAERISPWNPWWPHYGRLAAYVARCCALLRQGRSAADVLVYSLQAQVWTTKVAWGIERRVVPYGDLPKVLVASGYDYDPVNDDVLQRLALAADGRIGVGDLRYAALILQNVEWMPLRTLERVEELVENGAAVIALARLPARATGRNAAPAATDARVSEIVDRLFTRDGGLRLHAGGGRTWFLPDYAFTDVPLVSHSVPPAKTPPLGPGHRRLLDALATLTSPDVSLPDGRTSDGLTFCHRVAGDLDVYFVTNLQPESAEERLTFRVSGKRPSLWDPMSGAIRPVDAFAPRPDATDVPVRLGPWGSAFLVFAPEPTAPHLPSVRGCEEARIEGREVVCRVATSGRVQIEAVARGGARTLARDVPDVFLPLEVRGPWSVAFEGVRFPRLDLVYESLQPWSADPETAQFSGTATYETAFDIAAAYLEPEFELHLDLGAVGHVAEVALNGVGLGVCWMTPYRLPIGTSGRPGRNELRVRVTNLLIHHVRSLAEPPAVPRALWPRFGRQDRGLKASVAALAREKELQDLPASGLLGPVRVVAQRIVRLAL
jgi:hypothetical protein